MHKQLADQILKTVACYEAAYDKVASDKATRDAIGNPFIVDYEKFQTKSIKDAASEACTPELAFPVYLLLTSNWNDAIEWANAIVNMEKSNG